MRRKIDLKIDHLRADLARCENQARLLPIQICISNPHLVSVAALHLLFK
jgi:hypothetical protein